MKLSAPKLLLHLEGLLALGLACFFYHRLGASWTQFALLFLVPDVSMAGYLLGAKAGARVYNAAHTYLAPFFLGLIGVAAGWAFVLPFCAIWVAHIGFDRVMGYGLKYESGFKDTHLNRV